MSYLTSESVPWHSVAILAIRPKTLPASLSPVILGTALVPAEQIQWLLALCAFGCALFLQIAVNLANDYFDARHGVDSQYRLGPVRVTQAGLASPAAVASGIALFVVLSIICGLILVVHTDLYLMLVGVFCVLAVLAYSGGPFPLASHGLGEAAVLVFFGWVAVIGSAYVHTQQVTWGLYIASNGLGVILAAIMLVNNIRDIPTDRKAGKRTLAVKLGEVNSKRLYAFLLGITVVCHLCTFLLIRQTVVAALVPIVIYVPFAVRAIIRLYDCKGRDLNKLLAETAMLSLIYSLPTSVLVYFS